MLPSSIVATAASLDPSERTPREQHHTLVPALPDHDMPTEKIPDHAGHKEQATTETA
jgi:hypothetical protein